MPKIRISDTLNVELLTAPSGPGSGISKYFSGDTAGFIASTELATALTKPASSLTAGALGGGLHFASDGAFGTSEVAWTIAAGSKVSVDATQSGGTLPGDETFGHPIVVDAGKTLVSVGFSPSLSAGLTHGIGDLQFGFSAGGTVGFRAGRVFDLGGGAGPTLRDALGSLLASAVVPGNVLDVAAMEPGDVGSVSGSGTLRCSASFDVAQVFNPLASPALPLVSAGKVSLNAGPSLEVGASVSLEANYQIRVRKLTANRVELGYYKMAETGVRFDVTASAGVAVTAGKDEVLAKIMGLLGAPEADVMSLVEADLSDGQIKEVQKAVEASLSRSIAVSLAGSFSTDTTKTRMFEYAFELDRLGSDGVSALNRALQGDLAPLTSCASDALPVGVHLLVSELEEIRKKKSVWKLNLLGIVNVLRVSELIRNGRVLFNAETGELVVTDSVTAKKIRVETRPLETDSKKLHKVLMQSLVITAAYRASGTQRLDGSLRGSMSYFEQTGNARRQTISDYLDNLAGVNLISAAEKAAFLTHTFQGRASVFLDASFSDADFTTMFFDGAGGVRDAGEYDRIGRDAVARLIQPGDENQFRRIPMLAGDPASDKLWREMSDAGPASLQTVLPTALRSGPQLAVLRHDYIVIKWWADSMGKAAVAVRSMKAFIATTGLTAEELQDDPAFRRHRDELNSALKDVASDALPDFLDAWGIVAMDGAADRKSSVRGTLVTTGPILSKQRN